MTLVGLAAVLSTLLAVAVSTPSQIGSADDQVVQMLGSIVESAVTRALTSWQRVKPADLDRLQARLDAVERELAEIKLRDQGGSPQDGVYWFTGMPVPTLCDFSHDGGGWTLLLTTVSTDGWDALNVLQRNERSPSVSEDYAILRHADTIRDLGGGDRFAYRIEAQAQTGRRRWGGVWFAPRSYSFVHEAPTQTDISIVRKFDKWKYKNSGVEKRMPWLNTGDGPAVLTTSLNPGDSWWGTLASHGHTSYRHSPWIHPEAEQSGTVLYWIREQAF